MSGDALATGVCRYCDFEITLRATRTNKQFFGPFWRNEWVHDDTDEVWCWSPFASPIETLSADIAALVHSARTMSASVGGRHILVVEFVDQNGNQFWTDPDGRILRYDPDVTDNPPTEKDTK